MFSRTSSKKHDNFFSMLYSSKQSDVNCSSSTNALKLVINFLDELLEKNSDTKSFACHRMKILLL